MESKPNPLLSIGLLLLAAWLAFGGDGPLAPTKVTSVTYVHTEKAAIPPGVMAGLNELNAEEILATAFPENTTDGNGEVPDQYKVALPAARTSGIPSLVVQSEDKVLQTIKSPTTKQQVVEAVPKAQRDAAIDKRIKQRIADLDKSVNGGNP